MKPIKKPAGLDGAALELKALIGQAGFARRDRAARALFVSDYPRHISRTDAQSLADQLTSQGWTVALSGGLARLDWSFDTYRAFFEELAQSPPGPEKCGLARILRRHPGAFCPGMIRQARSALLIWDAGAQSALRARAGAALALSLRRREAVPAFYTILLDRPVIRAAGARPAAD